MYEFLEETAGDVLTRPCREVSPETTVGDLHRLFAMDDVESYPVVRNGEVIGIVSKFDSLRPFAFGTDQILPHYEEIMGTVVEEIMSRDVISANSDTRLARVLQTMVQHRIKSVPILDHENKLIGIVGRGDIFRALRKCTLPAGAPTPGPDAAACRRTG